MARVTRPGGRVVVLEITTPQKPPLSWFFRLWFDSAVPRLGPAGGRLRTPTPTCRARCAASRAPRRWPRAGGRRPDGRPLGAHGRAASSPCTAAPGRDAPRRHSSAPCSRPAGRGWPRRWSAPRSAWPRSWRATARSWASTRRARSPRAASACGPMLVFLAAAERLGRPQLRGRRGGGGAAAHGHARARRRARPRAAAARPPHRLRGGRAAGRHRHRRPALLARVRRAGGHRERGGGDARCRAPRPRSRAAS